MGRTKIYSELVDEAKYLLEKRELIKLQIAKLAMEACTIRHGGRSEGLYTLTDFSRDVGIPFKRLSDWVMVYKIVVSKIPEEIKTEKDWNKARKISESITKTRTLLNKVSGNKGSKREGKKELDTPKAEILQMFKHFSETTQSLIYTDESLKRALYHLNKIEDCLERDEKFLLNINDNAHQFIEKAKSIQKRTTYLLENLKKPKTKIRKRQLRMAQ